MANFWSGFAQGFAPAYERSSDRRQLIEDRENERAERLRDRKEDLKLKLWELGYTGSLDDASVTTLMQNIGDQIEENRKRDLAGTSKILQDKIRRENEQKQGDRAQQMGAVGLPLGGGAPYVADELQSQMHAIGVAGAKKKVEEQAAKEMREAEATAASQGANIPPIGVRVPGMTPADILRLGAEQEKADKIEEREAELEFQRNLAQIPNRPSGTDIAKGAAARAVANNHARNSNIKERFYEGINIETAHPAVLEDINKRIGEVDKLTKKMTDTYYTSKQVAEDIGLFRKQTEAINKLQSEGKGVPDELLDANINLGDQLVFLHSTRSIVPKGVSDLMANAPKRPSAPVLRGITEQHDSAVLAEDIARDIVALKDAVGEDAMLKAVGKIDRPVAEIQKTLGLFVDSKQFQKIEKLIQKSQGLNNIVLKIRSGAAVTESEAARFLKEFADPSRQNYFTALQNFASNERNKSRMALKTQQDAGYVFNKNLVDAIGAEEAAPTAKEPSKYKGLSSEEARKYDKLKKTDPAFMNRKMKELLELYKEKSGGK
jgi:hypothetical protein